MWFLSKSNVVQILVLKVQGCQVAMVWNQDYDRTGWKSVFGTSSLYILMVCNPFSWSLSLPTLNLVKTGCELSAPLSPFLLWLCSWSQWVNKYPSPFHRPSSSFAIVSMWLQRERPTLLTLLLFSKSRDCAKLSVTLTKLGWQTAMSACFVAKWLIDLLAHLLPSWTGPASMQMCTLCKKEMAATLQVSSLEFHHSVESTAKTW